MIRVILNGLCLEPQLRRKLKFFDISTLFSARASRLLEDINGDTDSLASISLRLSKVRRL